MNNKQIPQWHIELATAIYGYDTRKAYEPVPIEEKEERQPFESYPALADCLLHGANFWKTDSRWSETLEEINKVCAELTQLKTLK